MRQNRKRFYSQNVQNVKYSNCNGTITFIAFYKYQNIWLSLFPFHSGHFYCPETFYSFYRLQMSFRGQPDDCVLISEVNLLQYNYKAQ